MKNARRGVGSAAKWFSPRLSLPAVQLVSDSYWDVDDEAEFEALSAEAAGDVRRAAQVWRNGIAAIIAVMATGMVFKTGEMVSGLVPLQKVVVIGFVGTGFALAITALLLALAAEAGARGKRIRKSDLQRSYRKMSRYKRKMERAASGFLNGARLASVTGLLLMLCGIVMTWVVPQPTTHVSHTVVHTGGMICGRIIDSDDRALAIVIRDGEATSIPWETIKALRAGNECE
jgi:hypothetical protein